MKDTREALCYVLAIGAAFSSDPRSVDLVRIDLPRLRVVVRGVTFVFFGMVSLWRPANHHHNWSELEVVYVIARCELDFQLLRFQRRFYVK